MNLDLDGQAVATAWLAASSAGLVTQADARLNRCLIVESYRDAERHPAGLAFVGMSTDLVVVVSVPFLHGSVGPAGLFDLIVEADPDERWPVDDRTGIGKSIVSVLAKAAAQARKDGGQILCSIMPSSAQTDGMLLELPALAIAAQGITEATYVALAPYTPRRWQDSMPGAADPFTPPSPMQSESFSLFSRLHRVFYAVGLPEIEWQIHRLTSGETVRYTRYLKYATDSFTMEVSAAIGLEVGKPAAIWDVKPLDPLADYEQREVLPFAGDTTDDPDPLDGAPVDEEANNIIHRVFGT